MVTGGPPKRCQRRAKRKCTIIEIDAGDEATERGSRERVCERSDVSGMFSPVKYHWLLLAAPSPGLKIVQWGQACKPSECHAFLDPTEEGDADEVKGSDATYEFAAINPRVEEGELYLKCFTCHCQMCRQPTSVNTEFRQCPNLIQTGGWRRVPCHRTRGFVQRASKKRDDVVDFAQKMTVGILYAYAADPKNLDRGGRPYWLFRTAGKAWKLTAKVRAFEHPKTPIHKVGTWVVRAQW